MRRTAFRRGDGVPLRSVMSRASMTLEDVADRAGVSFQLIGFAATDKRWARESLSWRSAQLIEEALGVARGELFEYREVLNARERKEMG